MQQTLYRLLYVNVITSLETFLSDAFINTVMSNPENIRQFLETNLDFGKEKFCLTDLFKKRDTISDEVKNYLLSKIIWHNIEKVKPMYEGSLKIKFPEDLKEIFKHIIIRHDIVHRNGKDKTGKIVELTKEDIKKLIENVQTLVNFIDDQFSPF